MKETWGYTTPLHTQYKGFLLIELLVAIMIISSLSLILAQFQGNARNIHVAADERVQALNKATSFLEKIMGGSLSIGKKGRKEKGEDDEFEIEWKMYAPQPIKGLPLADIYQYVAVTVSWDDYAGKKRSLQLTTGVIRP